MTDALLSILAFCLLMGALLAAVCVVALPFWWFTRVAEKRSRYTRQRDNLKDEMVKAQWEFDRLWKRK